jgi:hypothetical protein
MSHPNTDLLVRSLEGSSDIEEQISLRAHFPCAHCQQELHGLALLLDAFKTKLEEPSAMAMASAVAAFRHGPWQRPTTCERIFAWLQFDSRQKPLLVGARSGRTPAQLLFATDDIDFDLHISSEKPAFVLGQALPHDNDLERVANQAVCLVSAEQVCSETTTDVIGQFAFSHISPGTYQIIVTVGGRSNVVLPEIAV